MEIAALATPGRRAREQVGNSPNVKRPASLEQLVNRGQPAGPMMSTGDLNNFIYRVHYEVEAMKHWGFSINAAMEDYANRLDHVNVTKVQDEMEGIRAELFLVTSDVKKVMATLNENDANIKKILRSPRRSAAR